jgi:hypothetical protein
VRPFDSVWRRARTWNVTSEESTATHPADRHVPAGGDHLVRAIDVDASPETVYRWLCQIRVAPYSYDLVDNLGRRSPRRLTPGADDLELGQRFQIGPLVEFAPGRLIAFRTTGTARRLFGDVAMSYEVVPGVDTRSRIVACVALGPLGRHGPGPWAAFLAAGDLVMIRKQLRTLRDLAERDDRSTRR